MISYIQYIKLYLFIIISIFLNSFTITSFAHEIKPSIADFYYDDNYLNFEIRLNAELILSNIDASKITNTNIILGEIFNKWNKKNKKIVVTKDAILPGILLKFPIPNRDINK